MDETKAGQERRCEPRIRFSWPLFFGRGHVGQLSQGRVVDLSRSGVCFQVSSDETPVVGSHVLTRFSYPSDLSRNFQIDSYFDWAEVVRVQPVGEGKNRCALRLIQPLPEQPGRGASAELGQVAVC